MTKFELLSGHTRLKAAVAALTIAFLAAGSAPAEARHRHHHGFSHHTHHARHGTYHRHYARHHGHSRSAGGGVSGFLSPTYSAIVVDANTGRTLSAENADAPHHPASITKVMTLYLLFEQLEKGRLGLDSELSISQHAAAQSPSKLGLRPGSTIEVEDAIKAIVTKSANDIAVAVAENIGGSESEFAEEMTRKAHALGMSHTTYRNASGLPNREQITTARDLTILGRAIQDRFPKYYRYFSTHEFAYGGQILRNHNHLLGRIEGMDGIKTGYTAASGFNLLTSVRRDGRHIVAAVLGGHTAGQRDRIMAGLIEDNLDGGSNKRTAVAIRESDDNQDDSTKVAEAAPREETGPRAELSRAEPAPRMEAVKAPPVVKPEPELAAETRPAARPVELAALDLAIPPVPTRIEKPRPAFVSGAGRPETDAADKSGKHPNRVASLDGSTSAARTSATAYAAPTSTPSNMHWNEGPAGHVHPAAKAANAKPAKAETEIAKSEPKAEAKVALTRPAHSGWMIQIGATDDAEKANSLLSRAKSESKATLASAHPFTEKVQKGKETLWRARFAGLEESSAEAACRSLKRSGFSCFPTRN